MSTSPDQNPGCLAAILRLFGGGNSQPAQTPSPAESFPYRVRDDFLSPAAMSFYRVLSSAVAEHAVLCPKVSLSDLFFVARPRENRAAANRIAQKHVDFVLCEPGTMKPLLGVELDDASHAQPERTARDEFVDQVFAAAQLPLLRVPAQRAYNPQEVAAQVGPFLAAAGFAASEPAGTMPALEEVRADGGTGPAPSCPKCAVPMVLRRAARGERQGQQFFGCPNYPKCRETLPLT